MPPPVIAGPAPQSPRSRLSPADSKRSERDPQRSRPRLSFRAPPRNPSDRGILLGRMGRGPTGLSACIFFTCGEKVYRCYPLRGTYAPFRAVPLKWPLPSQAAPLCGHGKPYAHPSSGVPLYPTATNGTRNKHRVGILIMPPSSCSYHNRNLHKNQAAYRERSSYRVKRQAPPKQKNAFPQKPATRN
jgi:hypothetical protein